MTCAPGQIDINHASLSDLISGFNLRLNKVVAQGIIDMRPWLQPRELDAVHGIDSGTLRRILASNQACATPTSTPPPSADACTSSVTVDIQAATLDELIQALNLPVKTAQSIVAARPFGTLKLLNRDRFNGLPGVHTGFDSKLCLTPMPVRTAISTFRWAYRSQNTTVARDGYSLAIPAGVIDGTGAWASVTPSPPVVAELPVGDWPKADFHIFGAWEGNGDRVFVTMPVDPLLADAGPGWEPYVVHTKADGTKEVDTDLTYNSQLNTVTVPATSLSFGSR
jgi:DNA uptake protein ComE-like DNA-binding protein